MDLSAAYDSVDHALLWARLCALGVPEHTVAATQSLYAGLQYQLRAAGVYVEPFPVTRGVKQGCPLSPKLFNAFIDGLRAHLCARCPGAGAVIAEQREPGFLYADDVVLLADTPDALQALIDAMHEFCCNLGLAINAGKTQIMLCLPPRARRPLTRWRLAGAVLEVVPEFKYLGLMLDGRASAQAMAVHRAKSFVTAYGVSRRTFTASVAPARALATLHLVHGVATPAGLYGCALWGVLLFPLLPAAATPAHYYMLADPVERARLRVLRQRFHLRRSTPSICMLWEFGMVPFVHSYVVFAARFYNSLVSRDAGSFYERCMYENTWDAAYAGYGTWAAHLAQALAAFLPAEEPWLCRLARGVPIDIQALQQAMQVAWCAHARSAPGFKVRSYFEHMAYPFAKGRAPYLALLLPHSVTCSMARFRLGSHCLRVETDRWLSPKPRRAARLCRRCFRRAGVNDGDEEGEMLFGELDDESHMLFTCVDTALFGLRHDTYPDILCCPTSGLHITTTRDLMDTHAANPRLARYIHACLAHTDQDFAAVAGAPIDPALDGRRRYVPL